MDVRVQQLINQQLRAQKEEKEERLRLDNQNKSNTHDNLEEETEWTYVEEIAAKFETTQPETQQTTLNDTPFGGDQKYTLWGEEAENDEQSEASFDLLEGLLSDSENFFGYEEEEHPSTVHVVNREDPDDISQEWNHEYSASNQKHRERPQRGPIDRDVDHFFDNHFVNVPITKQGKIDGVYLFGSRVMKTQVQANDIFVVISPSKKMKIQEFIAQFERVEAKRLKGLNSAFTIVTMLSHTPLSVLQQQSRPVEEYQKQMELKQHNQQQLKQMQSQVATANKNNSAPKQQQPQPVKSTNNNNNQKQQTVVKKAHSKK